MQRKISPDTTLNEISATQKRKSPKQLSFYKKNSPYRDTAITLVYRSGGYSMEEVENYFGLHYSRVSRIIRDVEKARNKTRFRFKVTDFPSIPRQPRLVRWMLYNAVTFDIY